MNEVGQQNSDFHRDGGPHDMDSRNKLRLSRRTQIVHLAVALACTLYLSTATCGDSPRTWARGFTWATSSASSTGKVSLYYIDQNDSHFIGALSFENISKHGDSHPVTIKGILAKDGLFYPDVELKVKADNGSPWEDLVSPAITGERTQVIVGIDKINSKLMVILDSFKPMISLKQFGKLKLMTGDDCVFELKYLRPPKSE